MDPDYPDRSEVLSSVVGYHRASLFTSVLLHRLVVLTQTTTKAPLGRPAFRST
jgi:hypothetical protein